MQDHSSFLTPEAGFVLNLFTLSFLSTFEIKNGLFLILPKVNNFIDKKLLPSFNLNYLLCLFFFDMNTKKETVVINFQYIWIST